MIQHYIEFLFPGSFVDETQTMPWASDRHPPEVIPCGAFGYRFFSCREVTEGGEVLRGQPTDFSGYTYIGQEMDAAAIKALPGGAERHSILLSNMEGNGWHRVVRTVRGNFKPLLDGDTVRAAPEN